MIRSWSFEDQVQLYDYVILGVQVFDQVLCTTFSLFRHCSPSGTLEHLISMTYLNHSDILLGVGVRIHSCTRDSRNDWLILSHTYYYMYGPTVYDIVYFRNIPYTVQVHGSLPVGFQGPSKQPRLIYRYVHSMWYICKVKAFQEFFATKSASLTQIDMNDIWIAWSLARRATPST